jgi:hypothetical protein
MSDTIQNLISTAGFSNTYEQERLTKLCQLVAAVCVDHIASNESQHNSIAAILQDFDMSLEDEQSC